MNRTLLSAAAAALLLSTGLGLADGLVPGSDTAIRSAQSRGDAAVAAGRFEAGASRTASTYGYPATTGAISGVPGSDTAVRDRDNADDAAVARGLFGARANPTYGYPAGRSASASDRADDRAANRTAGVPTTGMNGVLVPGSDSF